MSRELKTLHIMLSQGRADVKNLRGLYARPVCQFI